MLLCASLQSSAVELLLSSDGLRDGDGVVVLVLVSVVEGASALFRRRFEGETGGRRTLGVSLSLSLIDDI